MASKLHPQDFGFQSWIAMYMHLKHNTPSFFKQKTFIYRKFETPQDYINRKVVTCKITLQTLERNCWKEVKDCLLTDNDKHKLMDAVYGSTMSFDTEFMKRITRLINTI